MASLEKAGVFLKSLFRHHITVPDGREVRALTWLPSLGNALDQTALLGCFCLRKVVRIQQESHGWRKSQWVYLAKVFTENRPGGEQGGTAVPELKTLVWARQPPDRSTLGADREQPRDEWLGFWRMKKGLFFSA